MNYASFWQRFAATWIDVFIVWPLMFIQVWFESLSKTAAIILVIPMTAVYCAYTIFSHGRFGRTIGKYAMGIRVVRMTGERIGWREAWLRSSIDVVFSVLHVVAALAALATYLIQSITESAGHSVGPIFMRFTLLGSSGPRLPV